MIIKGSLYLACLLLFFCFLGDLIYYIIGLAYWQHPSFFAYFPIASTFEGILGDLYASSVANPVFTVGLRLSFCTAIESLTRHSGPPAPHVVN